MDTPTSVKLTPYEMMTAAHIGIMRQVQNLKKNRPDFYGADMANGWQLHIEGALGECAVAKALGLYWNGNIGSLKMSDVGQLEVRTRSKHTYDLIIRDADNDNAYFVLVTGTGGQYVLRGYIKGVDGKQAEYLATHGNRSPAYFVPQQALKGMSGLLRDIWSIETHGQ